MNNNFTFPSRQAPIPRPSPQTSTSVPTANRESNALRASVLDAALELGIGQNNTVTNWMFNSSLAEEEEEEDLRSPGLTNGSGTEESSAGGRYPFTPPSSRDPHLQPFPTKYDGHIYFDKPVDDFQIRASNATPLAEVEDPVPPRPVTPSRGKLRKKRADGYESDGVYMSDAGKRKDKKTKATKAERDDEKERLKEAKIRAKEEKLQEKREKEEERKRKKSLSKAQKSQGQDKAGYATGYETDGASKASKSSKKPQSKGLTDGGYETDSGYLSSTSGKSKTKSRFFKIGSKQSKPDLRQETVPAVPAVAVRKELISLPIASLFSSTSGPGIQPPQANPAHDVTDTDSFAATPMIPQTLSASVASRSNVTTPALHSPTSPTPGERPYRDSYGSSTSRHSATASSSQSHSRRQGMQFLVPEHGYNNNNQASQIPLPPSAASSPAMKFIEGSSPSPSKQALVLQSSLSPSKATSPTSPVHNISSSLPQALSGSPLSEGRYPIIHPPNGSTKQQATTPPTTFKLPQAMSSQIVPGHIFRTPSLSSQSGVPSISVSPQAFPTARNPVLPPAVHPLTIPKTQHLQAPSPSPILKSSTARVRPRNPPVDGFGPRHIDSPASIYPNHSNLSRIPSPNPRRPNLTIDSSLNVVPSTDYIVPSPYASPLPSPKGFAFYDIPPPSPPPSGPLPSVPPSMSNDRLKTQDGGSTETISRSRTPEQGLFSQPIPSIQRGREQPFPARPILPSTSSNTIGPGLEARVKVPRYRELYGLALPKGEGTRRAIDRVRDWEKERESDPNPEDAEWEDLGYDNDEDHMKDVLERFEEGRIGSETLDQKRASVLIEKPLSRSRSFEAIETRISNQDHGDDSDSDSDYHDDHQANRPTGKSSINGESNDFDSRWSGEISVYSSASVLDPVKSEEARRRFLQRVNDLYEDDGRETPPVPKIPDAFSRAAPGRSWNRF